MKIYNYPLLNEHIALIEPGERYLSGIACYTKNEQSIMRTKSDRDKININTIKRVLNGMVIK